eukprot:Trichotokara_eunicae@DN1240_c0_g1_i1.p1
MGKNQHSKDKLYVIQSEYGGQYKKHREQLPFRSLPFDCCALSLLPFEEPLATRKGLIFDKKYILPYIKKYKRNPTDGGTLSAADLRPIIFHKNPDGLYHCPITYKIFTKNSHIILNWSSGHVYSNDAIDNLNRKTKKWIDLITNVPFDPSIDLVDIQGPMTVQTRNIEDFVHMKAENEEQYG